MRALWHTSAAGRWRWPRVHVSRQRHLHRRGGLRPRPDPITRPHCEPAPIAATYRAHPPEPGPLGRWQGNPARRSPSDREPDWYGSRRFGLRASRPGANSRVDQAGDSGPACPARRGGSAPRAAARSESDRARRRSAAALIVSELAHLTFADYADEWMRDRVLQVRTEELYEGLLRNHLIPTFGATCLGDIDEAVIRRWRKDG